MAASGGPGGRTVTKQLKVLLPPSLHKLRISDELAACFDAAAAGGGAGDRAEAPTALVVSPLGKVWRVEVDRDGEGAFLGRGWAEFLAAHGVGVGWFVVLRHEGAGAITVKVFDTSFCIKEFGCPIPVMPSRRSKYAFRKPQFIRIIHQDSMEKMIIPDKFVKRYVTEEYLNSRMSVIFSPSGKFWRIELENDKSGVFLGGGWSQFLAFHGISEGDILLLRHEGNMVFKFKVFGLNGCQKDFKNQNCGIEQSIEKQQESPPIGKRKSNNEAPSWEGNMRQKSSMTCLNKASPRKGHNYQTGPLSWIKKEISTSVLDRFLMEKIMEVGGEQECDLYLPVKFCHSIGFRKATTIMLKTAMDSTRSWQVRGLAYNKGCYLLGEGWKSFCQENRLKEGDLCTFNVIKTTLWHVVITRSSTDINRQKEPPSSRERESKNDRTSRQGHKPTGSKNSLNKASAYTRSVYNIGPPSWIRKEITNNSLKNYLSLAMSFCHAIRLQETRLIMLKTSINSTRSWPVRGIIRKNGSFQLGPGWNEFCVENRLKVGDVCTFNVVKTALWHVVIMRR
ncbi:hypothetical protein ACP70R_011892 [Stipagrostis hirtigluma subsp. patula]